MAGMGLRAMGTGHVWVHIPIPIPVPALPIPTYPAGFSYPWGNTKGKGHTILVNKGETYLEQGNKISYIRRTMTRGRQGLKQGMVRRSGVDSYACQAWLFQPLSVVSSRSLRTSRLQSFALSMRRCMAWRIFCSFRIWVADMGGELLVGLIVEGPGCQRRWQHESL